MQIFDNAVYLNIFSSYRLFTNQNIKRFYAYCLGLSCFGYQSDHISFYCSVLLLSISLNLRKRFQLPASQKKTL